MRLRSFLGLCMLLLLGSIPEGAWGQGQLTTAVAPARVEKIVNPGSKVTDVMTFTNQGDVPVTVTLSLVDFDMNEAGEVVELPPGTASNTVAPYFRISPLRTVVAPQERANFRYSVQTPEDFDQLRAFVYFESEPQEAEETDGRRVVFATAMGIPFYVESRKAERGALTIDNVTWERTGDEQEYLTLKLSATNIGGRNVRPGGFLMVRSEDDAFSQTFDVNPGGDVVLPGHTRDLSWRFGPVPAEALSLKLRFETSYRSNHESDHHLPAAGE